MVLICCMVFILACLFQLAIRFYFLNFVQQLKGQVEISIKIGSCLKQISGGVCRNCDKLFQRRMYLMNVEKDLSKFKNNVYGFLDVSIFCNGMYDGLLSSFIQNQKNPIFCSEKYTKTSKEETKRTTGKPP
eukprot:TRINITY_DN21197_c0_g1_i1.p2 TRINITY_DN21197_c0_g1~~TRINITY_DN21197_c0_g1_i1.p2  ORF type:complete len:131 (-),score=2.58 TRINITY_DN21197_c0_g1_i1:16-408(-)